MLNSINTKSICKEVSLKKILDPPFWCDDLNSLFSAGKT